MKRSVKIPILWPIMLLERETLSTASPPVYQMIIGYTHKLCGYYRDSNGEAALLHSSTLYYASLMRQETVSPCIEGALIKIQTHC